MAGYDSARTGQCQYIYWLDDGGSTEHRFGYVHGGSVRFAEAPVHRMSVGGVDKIAGALITPVVQLDIWPDSVGMATASNPLEDLWDRDISGSGVCAPLTGFDIRYGSESELQFTDCKVQSLAWACAQGDALSARLEAQGLLVTAATLGSPTIPAGGGWFEWYNAGVTVAGADYGVRSYVLTISNNLIPIVTLATKATNKKRFPERLLEGRFSVTLECRTLKEIPPATLACLADELTSTIAFAATHYDASGNSISLALSGGANASAEYPVVADDGVVEYPYTFETVHNSATSFAVAYA